MSSYIENLVEKLSLDFLKDTEVELVDVEYVQEHDWYLRVFIDKNGGIDIEDCQRLSEQLEEKLDELDPVKESYFLEVSSPGLDRVLRKDKDFDRHMGDMIEVTTYMAIDGNKSIVGKLSGFSKDAIEVEGKSILRDKIAKIRLHLEF